MFAHPMSDSHAIDMMLFGIKFDLKTCLAALLTYQSKEYPIFTANSIVILGKCDLVREKMVTDQV